MKTVEDRCGTCNAIVKVAKKEWVRQKKKNPNRKFYCDLICSGKRPENSNHLDRVRSNDNTAAYKAAAKKNRKYSQKEKPFAEIIRRTKNRSTVRNRCKEDFDLDIEYLMTLWIYQDKKCALTDIPLSFNEANKLLYPSLDRKDSQRGYCRGNVQFVCTAANLGKGAGTDTDFKEFIGRILKNNR